MVTVQSWSTHLPANPDADSKQELTGQNLTGQKLIHQKLTGQKLTNQKRTGKKLTSQKLTGQKLTSQKLTGQKLTNQKLTGQKLTCQNLTEQKLTRLKRSKKCCGEKLTNFQKNSLVTIVGSALIHPCFHHQQQPEVPSKAHNQGDQTVMQSSPLIFQDV